MSADNTIMVTEKITDDGPRFYVWMFLGDRNDHPREPPASAAVFYSERDASAYADAWLMREHIVEYGVSWEVI